MQVGRSSFDEQQQPATYGLATQLRTPPMEHNPFPAHNAVPLSSSLPPKKVTPAMREELKSSKPAPAWGSRESSTLPMSKSMRDKAQTLKREYNPQQQQQNVNEMGMWEDKGSKQSSHLRSRSQGNAPARPARPQSPTGAAPYSRTAPPPVPTHIPAAYTSSSAITSPPLDFNPHAHQLPRLDLGVQLDGAPYSTFKSHSSKPSLGAESRKKSTSHSAKDDEEGLYEANVSVGVAQRVQRASSFRKASLGALLQPNGGPSNLSGSSLVASLNSERKGSADSASSGGSQLRPPRASISGETPRPIGQGVRSSYGGSGAPSTVFRRSSSVYIPNPVAAPPPTITPAARLPLDLVTLAKRTAHISDVPGYGWRLHLLEKLETIMGSFLTVADAEAILSIGHGSEKKSNKRSESRKSQIGMPTSTPRPTKANAPVKAKAPEKSSFFTKMKRALSSPGSHDHPHDKTPPPPLPTAKNIFGVSLSVVSEYGFVTSMIAGQRHDLPGVCFSTVEEIYRRGQGMNVPGLLHLAGEASRVAKLVAIFDSAPDYGEHHDLSIESIHNVTSLLKKYLRDLPEPILDQRLWRLYLSACVDSTNPIKSRIACAQIILRLLPTPNFSLLVYLVAFLSQMPLFPENRLTLESVSTIFGPAAMSPRMTASAASKLPKLSNGGMHITGPTESFESTGANVKKAQDGLLWLLTHWSSVADGLLEPDFDVDVDEVLGRRASISAAPAAEEEQLLDPSEYRVRDEAQRTQSTHTLEILSAPRFDSVEAPRRAPSPMTLAPPIVAKEEQPSPVSTVKSPSSPILPRNFGFTPSPRQNAEAEAIGPLTPVAPDEDAPPTPSKEKDEPKFKNRESALPSVPGDEEEDLTTNSAQASDATTTPESTSSSRSSDSSLQSTWVQTPTMTKEEEAPHSPLLRGNAMDVAEVHEQNDSVAPLPRATPEDEFGPLDPPNTSVLEDLLEFDADSSIYSFPSPPGTRNFKATAPFSTAAFEPKPPVSPSADGVVLVRTSADQLKEAQALVETQRSEIQSLWKQLTDVELARTADRTEMEHLRAELSNAHPSKDWDVERAQLEEDHQVALSAMDAKFRSAQREAQKAREELKAFHEERLQQEELRQEEDRETKQRILSLESQLNGIRGLLNGARF